MNCILCYTNFCICGTIYEYLDIQRHRQSSEMSTLACGWILDAAARRVLGAASVGLNVVVPCWAARVLRTAAAGPAAGGL